MFTFDVAPLNKAQERKLINDTPDREELNTKLIEHNYMMVLKEAHKYKQANSFEDLVQEGSKGLVIAAERFDTSRDIKFNSFAIWYIKKYIFQYIGLAKRESTLSEDHEQNVISLDGTLTSKDLNSIENTSVNPDEDIVGNELSSVLKGALTGLNSDEQFVIKNRLLAPKSEILTLKNISQKLKYSLSNIKAIETRALAKMQHHLHSCNIYTSSDVFELAV